MMDSRAAKLALARQKLKNHQEKKTVLSHKDGTQIEQQQTETQQVESVNNSKDEIEPTTFENAPLSINIPPLLQTQMDDIHQSFRENNDVLNVSEILISSKRNLELQVNELQLKLSQLENNYTLAINNSNYCKQQLSSLELELKTLQDMYVKASDEIISNKKIISELKHDKSVIYDENNNLQEQLEFTKSMLTSKESESSVLIEQNKKLQNQLDALQLQIQQITSGAQDLLTNQSKADEPDRNPDILIPKIAILEQQLKTIQKERNQINCHYQQYVGELNEQLKSAVIKNNELSLQVQNLSVRENDLVEQISEMEIQIQNMRQQQQPIESHMLINQDVEAEHNAEMKSLQHKYDTIQVQLKDISKRYEELQTRYSESEAKVQNLNHVKESECEHDSISISKLTADIASDKLAAQRATEQNKKLKVDLQELEEAFIKISKDKLELTEKVAAEKFLNRELTLKLADAEEKATDFHIKLKAKDDEMIRLQNSYRELEKKVENIYELDKLKLIKSPYKIQQNIIDCHNESCAKQAIEISADLCQNHQEIKECQPLVWKSDDDNKIKIPKEDAMIKLQDRFLKIMDEVANLSDEKHRLEHIILQLQNETDTICEYVALYQQQRSLLKKRDEERSAQIKIFQAECERLKSQLEELSGIIIRLAQDTELAVYFQTEPRCSDLAKVMKLLTNLKSNTLVDPHKISSELKNFYPCSCCSGQLIEV